MVNETFVDIVVEVEEKRVTFDAFVGAWENSARLVPKALWSQAIRHTWSAVYKGTKEFDYTGFLFYQVRRGGASNVRTNEEV
jgi:hypothetical protein